MSFYKRRRPKPEEEKCADPAKARARAPVSYTHLTLPTILLV